MDHNLKRIAQADADFPQHFPKPGWVEQDLQDIWNTVLQTLKQVTQSIDPKKILAIGITNQRETLCFWDRQTRQPLGRAIVWQDRRTTETCAQLKAKGLEPFFQDQTGLLLDPYFSATKASWALEHWQDVKSAYRAGRLAIGTIDSYLIAQLSGGKAHVTEPSNASRTLCFHLHQHRFDSELCRLLDIPIEIWPEVQPSVGKFAITQGVGIIPDGIPITGVLGDQQSALLGQACIQEGMAKCTYGTGAFLLLNTGSKPIRSQHKLLSTVAWALSATDYTYALEGSAFIAGAAVQWLRDGLNLIQSSAEIEPLARSVPSTNGLVFVPALTGLGAPYWAPNATGLFTGITRGTTRAHFARAVLEGIAFQNSDILCAMQQDLQVPLKALHVDGGAAANNFLMQFQSDLLGIPLRRPQFLETTSLGAIFAAGLGAGVWSSLVDIKQSWTEDCVFQPAISPEHRTETLQRWKHAVAQTLYQDE
jgi:glycerol kinase